MVKNRQHEKGVYSNRLNRQDSTPQTGPPRPGAESDIYDFVVATDGNCGACAE